MTGKGEKGNTQIATSNNYNTVQDTDSERDTSNNDNIYTSIKADCHLDNIIISEEEHEEENSKLHDEVSNNMNNHNVSSLLNASGTTNLIPCSGQTYAYGNGANSSTNTSMDNQLAAMNKTITTLNHEDKEN